MYLIMNDIKEGYTVKVWIEKVECGKTIEITYYVWSCRCLFSHKQQTKNLGL